LNEKPVDQVLLVQSQKNDQTAQSPHSYKPPQVIARGRPFRVSSRIPVGKPQTGTAETAEQRRIPGNVLICRATASESSPTQCLQRLNQQSSIIRSEEHCVPEAGMQWHILAWHLVFSRKHP